MLTRAHGKLEVPREACHTAGQKELPLEGIYDPKHSRPMWSIGAKRHIKHYVVERTGGTQHFVPKATQAPIFVCLQLVSSSEKRL